MRNQSGDVFKPSTLRGYEQALRDRILPELGAHRLSHIRRQDIQRLADELLAAGADASTIRNTIMPLRVIFRRREHEGATGAARLDLAQILARSDPKALR